MAQIQINRKNKNYGCSFELALDIIAGKWKLVILYIISKNEVVRYGELKNIIQGINERMLTRQLRELEKDRLIHREVYKQAPPKVEYSLTNVGKSVIPIIDQLEEWGISYNDEIKKL